MFLPRLFSTKVILPLYNLHSLGLECNLVILDLDGWSLVININKAVFVPNPCAVMACDLGDTLTLQSFANLIYL